MKKKIFTQIFFIFCVLILIATPINIISTSFALRSYDSVDKEKPNPSDAFITTLNGKEYLAEYITREKVEEMKKQSELRVSNKNYNQIIDGHGTGYAPPTAEDLEKLIGKVSILDVIPDAGLQNYGASADISTEIYFPVVGDQGSQGSCTAWANAYYAYGYMEAKDYAWDASSGNTDYLLSPAWAYNKVAAYDYGSVPVELAELIIEWGVSTLSTMPYNDFDVDSWGEEPAWREAPYHRPLNYDPIFFVGPATIDTIKNLLDSGIPVTFGIDASQFGPGLADNYIISSAEYEFFPYELNHAQCFVGYDDIITDDGDFGAFRVVNSWGPGWGDNGYYWLTYDAFSEFADDPYQSILYYTDRIDYNPSLIGTWEYSDAPTRMDDIITLGVGTYETPLGTINPLYDNDIVNSFPEFMALDISDFQTYYNADPDVFFYLDVGSSTTTGTISSFLIERYIGGSLVEISPESPDVPEDTPGYVYNTFKIFDHELKVSLEVPSNPEIGNSYMINTTVTNTGLNDEYDVDLLLYLDDVIVDSTTISTLPVGASETINYMWIPPDFGSYNFTAYAPPIPGETYLGNNIVTKIIDIVDVQLFDGMFIDYTWTIFGNAMPAQFIWSHLSGAIFHTDWYMDVNHDYWDVDAQTRVMSNSGGSGWYFGDGYHSPLWIFTDVSIGDQMFIAVDAEGDHLFEVSSELIYDLPGFGLVEVLELEDLTFPGGFAWYEKSTGIILNGTFFYMSGGDYNYTFDFLDTNVEFSYVAIDHDIKVSSDVPINPEIGNSYMINATVTNTGLNDEFDVDLLLYLDDVIVASTIISSLPIGASETINYLWIPPDYGTYNFTTYASPVPDESYLANNLVTKIIHIVDTKLFDGMYIDLNYTEAGTTYPTRFSYSFYSGSLFYETWEIMGSPIMWYVDSQTRIMSGGSVFGDGTHTPAWIFTDVSIGDQILIAADAEGDHLFEVSRELIYDLPGFGLVEIWELEDLTFPPGIAWYEKSTGILLNGTFYYGSRWYTFNFVDTNVEFTYYEPLSLTITTPDSTSSWETGTSQSITWTSTGSISDVKIELYKGGVFEMEIIAITTNAGTYNWDIPTDLEDGIDYQIKISDVANPAATNDFSEDFEIFTTPVVIDSIIVTTPDSLTAWEMGTSQDIYWTSTGIISDVKIELYKDGVFEREIIASTTNDGSFDWTIPTDLVDGIDYTIRISDASNSATFGESPNFALTTADTGDGTPAIPGYDLLFLFGVIITISVVAIIKTGKRKLKLQ